MVRLRGELRRRDHRRRRRRRRRRPNAEGRHLHRGGARRGRRAGRPGEPRAHGEDRRVHGRLVGHRGEEQPHTGHHQEDAQARGDRRVRPSARLLSIRHRGRTRFTVQDGRVHAGG